MKKSGLFGLALQTVGAFLLFAAIIPRASFSLEPGNLIPVAADVESSLAHAPAYADELWVVSSRHLGCPSHCGSSSPLAYFRGSSCERLYRTDQTEFHANAQGLRTVIYVHGNRIDCQDAVTRGRRLHRQLLSCSDSPFRLVIWSWPSTQISGPIRDVKAKVRRASSESVYLARFLHELPSHERVSLFGFSLGARIIGGALHLNNGGSLNGHHVGPGPDTPFLVAMAAAAMHRDWMLPGHRYGNALQNTGSFLNYFNTSDPVLRFYKHADCGTSEALGYKGLPCTHRLLQLGVQVKQCDVKNVVGSSHAEAKYMCASLIHGLRRQLIPSEVPLPTN